MRHPWADLRPAHPIRLAALVAAAVALAGVAGFLTPTIGAL